MIKSHYYHKLLNTSLLIGIFLVKFVDKYICVCIIFNSRSEVKFLKKWWNKLLTNFVLIVEVFVLYLGLWESINNENFKGHEFETFESEAGKNSFYMSPQKWIKATNAIGIISKSGNNGGTFAHSDFVL